MRIAAAVKAAKKLKAISERCVDAQVPGRDNVLSKDGLRGKAKRGFSLHTGFSSAMSPLQSSMTSTAQTSTTSTSIDELSEEMSRGGSSAAAMSPPAAPVGQRPGPSTTQPAAPTPSSSDDVSPPKGSYHHARNPSNMSVDDNYLEKVRYIEDQTGQPVIERGQDLERPPSSQRPSKDDHDTVDPPSITAGLTPPDGTDTAD